MTYTIGNFCEFVQRDINGLLNEIVSKSNRHMTDNELVNLEQSYRSVSGVLTIAIKKNPTLSHVHIALTPDMLLEYQIPSSSAYCDVVLLGEGNGKKQVFIIELKNYSNKSNDIPKSCKRDLINHNGELILHPAAQVRQYVDYCKGFHSTVQEYKADVNGCVLFTQDINLEPYQTDNYKKLTTEYPIFNTKSIDNLSDLINSRIQRGDKDFSVNFEKGYYLQNHDVLKQAATNLSIALQNQNAQEDLRPFVLLDNQLLGRNMTLNLLEQCIQSNNQKEVVIIEGPPGSGKSAIAISLWIEASKLYPHKGNIVYVTTSQSQGKNWKNIFSTQTSIKSADDFCVSSYKFNPGIVSTRIKSFLEEMMQVFPESIDINDKGEEKLSYKDYEKYTRYLQEHHSCPDYFENHHFLSIVDEAHALINPLSPDFADKGNNPWCAQLGPQAYHIIYESKVSIFLLDSNQGFRDSETTSVHDIESYAQSLGAHVNHLSLENMQFRCAGSKDYVDWVDSLFYQSEPLKNLKNWNQYFKVQIVSDPFEMEELLRNKQNRNNTIRIFSTFSQEWISSKALDEEHNRKDIPYDFNLDLGTKGHYQKYWNKMTDYEVYVQGARGKMHDDPLCEIGCPYVVRGFDYDYIGILCLGDLVRRNNHWWINLENVKETSILSTKKKAREEQLALNKLLPRFQRRKPDEIKNGLIEVKSDGSTPMTYKLFKTIAGAYRILLTRAVKGVYLYIQDDETREYIKSLLA